MDKCNTIFLLVLFMVEIAVSTVTLLANPSDIAPGLTNTLTVNCSFDVQNSNMAALISMFLSFKHTALTSASEDFKELASINSYTGLQTNLPPGASATSSGNIQVIGQSFLLVEFPKPSINQTGQYKCNVNGMDGSGHPITDTKAIHVTAHKPSADDIISKVELLEAQNQEAKIEISLVDKNLRQSFAQAMSYLENTVNTRMDNLNTSFNVCLESQNSFQALSARIDIVNETFNNDKEDFTVHVNNQLTVFDTKVDTKINALNFSTRTELQFLSNAVKDLQQQVVTSVSLIQNLQQQLNITERNLRILENKQDDFAHKLNSTETVMFHKALVYHSSKYLLSRNDFKDVNAAMAICELFGGYLAEIDDVHEYDVVVKYLKTFSSQMYFGFIIGGTDEANEGHWVYQYSHRPLTFTRWGQGQPIDGRKANCLAIYANYNYVMADEPCFGHEANFPFLCEVPI